MRPFLQEEVQVARKGLNADGTPGPDGLHMFFYSEFGGLVGLEFLVVIYEKERIP